MSKRRFRNQGKSITLLDCDQCGAILTVSRPNAKYCSNACRQKAYRARKTTPMERAIRKIERYKKMVATKAATITTTKCCGCGCEMSVTGLQVTRKLYHNNACKMRAYRERKAAKHAIRNHQS